MADEKRYPGKGFKLATWCVDLELRGNVWPEGVKDGSYQHMDGI